MRVMETVPLEAELAFIYLLRGPLVNGASLQTKTTTIIFDCSRQSASLVLSVV
jgi:hypothetical protein